MVSNSLILKPFIWNLTIFSLMKYFKTFHKYVISDVFMVYYGGSIFNFMRKLY